MRMLLNSLPLLVTVTVLVVVALTTNRRAARTPWGETAASLPRAARAQVSRAVQRGEAVEDPDLAKAAVQLAQFTKEEASVSGPPAVLRDGVGLVFGLNALIFAGLVASGQTSTSTRTSALLIALAVCMASTGVLWILRLPKVLQRRRERAEAAEQANQSLTKPPA